MKGKEGGGVVGTFRDELQGDPFVLWLQSARSLETPLVLNNIYIHHTRT